MVCCEIAQGLDDCVIAGQASLVCHDGNCIPQSSEFGEFVLCELRVRRAAPANDVNGFERLCFQPRSNVGRKIGTGHLSRFLGKDTGHIDRHIPITDDYCRPMP